MQTTVQPNIPSGRAGRDDVDFSRTTPADDARTVLINRISWGAVLAGVVLTLSAQFILNMIGVGVGAATIDPVRGDSPTVQGFSTGAAIWWAGAGVIASFVGGLLAGRLSGSPRASTGGLHGITAWALTTLVIVYMFGSAAQMAAGGALSAMSNLAGGAARGAAQSAASAALPSVADPFSQIEQQIRINSGSDPQTLRDASIAAVRALVTGEPAQAEAARNRAAETLARAQNIPVEEARTRIAQYEQQYREGLEQARVTATQAADTAARTISMTTLLASLALLLGALAAWFGGRMGVVDPVVAEAGSMAHRDATIRS